MKYNIPINGEWQTVTDEQLAIMRREGQHEVENLIRACEINPLAYMLPHGIPWCAKERSYAEGRIIVPPSNYPKKYKDDGVAFLSDTQSDYVMLVAPRKSGKSVLGCNFIGLRANECDPNWMIFKEHGVEFIPFDGPTTAVIGSFGWTNVAELWEVYRHFLPRDELGPYSPEWGKFPGESGRPRNLTFGDGRPKSIIMQRSKSRFVFLCYTQQQHVWENFKAKLLHADEQIPMDKLTAWLDSTRNMGDYTPACFTLSGFRLKERSDTGASGELKVGLWDGERDGGKTIGRYHIDIDSVPDAIMTPKKKQEAYDKYVNPEIERTEKDAKRGLACYFPGWEPGGGLAFGDVWNREIHVIPPLWADDKIPKNWTKWRVIDYADRQTSCCGWFAVGPKFAVLYRLLYEKDMLVAELVKEVIAMSHNKQLILGQESDPATGSILQQFEEDQCEEQFYCDLLDPRAAEWRQQGETLIDLFRRYGMANITAASARRNKVQIPLFKDWLKIEKDMPHPTRKNEDGSVYLGAPKLFFFEGLTNPAQREIEQVQCDESVSGESVINKKDPHDFIDVGKYWASDKPDFRGDWDEREHKEEQEDDYEPNEFTGY